MIGFHWAELDVVGQVSFSGRRAHLSAGECEPRPTVGQLPLPMVIVQKCSYREAQFKMQSIIKMGKFQRHDGEFQRAGCKKYTYQIIAVTLKFLNILYYGQAHAL